MWWFFSGGVVTAIGIIAMEKPFHKLALSSVGLLDTLLDPNEGEEKFQKLQTRIFQALSILIIFILLSFLVLIPTWLLAEVTAQPNLLDITTPIESHWGIYIIGSIIPFIILNFIPKKSDYSSISQLLHRLILNHYNLGGWMLRKQIKNIDENIQPRAILITGLARAGTTALTKWIAQSEEVKSLDYSNMPFLLYPRFWRKIYRPKKKAEQKERAHGDGVKVGLSSVEALEEYFFKVVKNDSFINEDTLTQNNLSEQELSQYCRYQASISGSLTYLAKNNNGLLRLGDLIKNPNQQVFIMYRDPLEHAYSLLKQHRLFTKMQEEDSFVLEYMDWLGHYEFGKHQKSFSWNNTYSYTDSQDINFWLERWIAYYEQALKFKNHSQITFISYESFLTEPEKVISVVTTKSSLSKLPIEIRKFHKKQEVLPQCDGELLKRALGVFDLLLGASN